MILQNCDPFKKNKREALIKKMVLKRLGDEIRPISYQKFVFPMNLVDSGCDKNIIKTKAIYWRETLKMSISEQNAEIVPSALRVRCGQYFLIANWNLFGLRGDFPYYKRFVLAGTKREPSNQSLWEKCNHNHPGLRIQTRPYQSPPYQQPD